MQVLFFFLLLLDMFHVRIHFVNVYELQTHTSDNSFASYSMSNEKREWCHVFRSDVMQKSVCVTTAL